MGQWGNCNGSVSFFSYLRGQHEGSAPFVSLVHLMSSQTDASVIVLVCPSAHRFPVCFNKLLSGAFSFLAVSYLPVCVSWVVLER